MYQIYSDNYLIHDPRLKDYQVIPSNPNLELNKTGDFSFTILPSHPYYDKIKPLKSIIKILRDGKIIFRGRVLKESVNFRKEITYSCEGQLAFLLDSRVRPFEHKGDVATLFAFLINQHNEQVEDEKKFIVGNVTVTDPNDYLNRSNTTYDSTWDIINTRLIEPLGGYLNVRNELDGNYIDYLQDFDLLCTQEIEYASNLLDFLKTSNEEDIITALIPLGAKISDEEGKETNKRLTISEINDGKDYVYDEEAVNLYGWIFGAETWDDVTIASNLKQKGIDLLTERKKTLNTFQLTAADISKINPEVSSYGLGKYIYVTSKYHGLEHEKFLISKYSPSLTNPADDKLTFGREFSTFSESVNDNDNAISDLIDRTEVIESDYVTNEDVTSITEDVYSKINQTAEEIMLEVGGKYVTNDQFTEELNTRFTQTEDSFEFQFNEFKQYVENVNGETQTSFEELRKYIRFVEGNIILGDQNSDLQCVITNEKISFAQNSSEVAYISNNKLYITNAEVLDRLTVGNPLSGYFDWIPRANGNLGMKWRAG